jgi:hypothetical protein
MQLSARPHGLVVDVTSLYEAENNYLAARMRSAYSAAGPYYPCLQMFARSGPSKGSLSVRCLGRW